MVNIRAGNMGENSWANPNLNNTMDNMSENPRANPNLLN